jgi:hypothetical protein
MGWLELVLCIVWTCPNVIMASRPPITDICGACITGNVLPRTNMVDTSISNYCLIYVNHYVQFTVEKRLVSNMKLRFVAVLKPATYGPCSLFDGYCSES